MATFNSMPALPSGATPGADALGLTVDPFDHSMAFGESLLDPNNIPPMPFTPNDYDFDAFGTAFEDPFSYNSRPSFETLAAAAMAVPEDGYAGADSSSPQEIDNKLLSFSAPIPGKAAVTLVTETGRFIEPGMTAELLGMFFVAEDVFGVAGDAVGRPLELTCYRRNLWQCLGQITLPRNVMCFVGENGQPEPVVELAASITAIESIEGRTTEIISIPWKSNNNSNGGGADETKVAGAPPMVMLDLGSGTEIDGSRVSVSVAWKRLQFKHATANNGRRKGLQQHYVVQINLLARGKDGEWAKVAEIRSGPVIVRGRSPRNFDSRKDVPLTGEKKNSERRNTEGGLTGGGKMQHQQQYQQQLSPTQAQDRGDQTHNVQRYQSLGNVQSDWATPRHFSTTPNTTPQLMSKKAKLSTSPTFNRPPVPSWTTDAIKLSQSTPTPSTRAVPPSAPTLPINLSLSEDERSPNRSTSSNDGTQSPQFVKSNVGLASGGSGSQSAVDGGKQVQDLEETADMLYEYFPLSLDDWMPPVDAIYRPHVVHHTVVPPEVKAQQSRSKTKRYFAAE